MGFDDGNDEFGAGLLEDVMDKRTNDFDELEVRELPTQWRHKISVIPESEGITERWWTFSAGVTRSGPEAEIPPGEDITTDESGEYNVGDPALGGMAFRIEGSAVDGAGDDAWAGYTNRLIRVAGEEDGAGIGRAYFADGEGDLGGADGAGEQDYVWFRSAVPGVSDLRIPRDQWNGDEVENLPDVPLTELGGFLRIDFTFYDHGQADVNWGVKTGDGLVVVTLHSFEVQNNPMWQASDMFMQAANAGTNLTAYTAAAHFKAPDVEGVLRGEPEIRDGTISGSSVSVSSGTPVPLISLRVRDGWENINLSPLSANVEMNDAFYVFFSLDADLNNATFDAPLSDIPEFTAPSSEYAVLTDVDATGFGPGGAGDPLLMNYSPGGGAGNSGGPAIAGIDNFEEFGLAVGETVTLGVIPVDATSFAASSLNWGSDF